VYLDRFEPGVYLVINLPLTILYGWKKEPTYQYNFLYKPPGAISTSVTIVGVDSVISSSPSFSNTEQ
jgi:hypothetical protein